MKKNEWSEQRLQRLFAHYNRRFWRGRLPSVRIRIRDLDGSCGQIEWARREILIDIAAHTNDEQKRATLLHEMAHLATTRKSGHASEFWSQIEHLLRQKAPITVDSAETPGLKILQGVVPRRFPLARRMMHKAEKRRAREVSRLAQQYKLEHGDKPRIHSIGETDILEKFGDVEAAGLPWRQALLVIGTEYGLIDVDGKPTNRWAADVIAKGEKVHARSRRDHLSYEKRLREIEGLNPDCTRRRDEPADKNPSP